MEDDSSYTMDTSFTSGRHYENAGSGAGTQRFFGTLFSAHRTESPNMLSNRQLHRCASAESHAACAGLGGEWVFLQLH